MTCRDANLHGRKLIADGRPIDANNDSSGTLITRTKQKPDTSNEKELSKHVQSLTNIRALGPFVAPQPGPS